MAAAKVCAPPQLDASQRRYSPQQRYTPLIASWADHMEEEEEIVLAAPAHGDQPPAVLVAPLCQEHIRAFCDLNGISFGPVDVVYVRAGPGGGDEAGEGAKAGGTAGGEADEDDEAEDTAGIPVEILRALPEPAQEVFGTPALLKLLCARCAEYQEVRLDGGRAAAVFCAGCHVRLALHASPALVKRLSRLAGPEEVPKSVREVFGAPALLNLLCDWCARGDNVVLEGKRMARAFCGSCCIRLSRSPAMACNKCGAPRHVDCLGKTGKLCAGCHQRPGGAPGRRRRAARG